MGWSNLGFVPSVPVQRAFLDAAPGPLHPAARAALLAAMATSADPQARHAEGRAARHALDQARSALAGALGVDHLAVSFLPSSADALVAALNGLAHARRRVGHRCVVTAVDRAVVLTNAPEPTIVPVDRMGRVEVERYAAELSPSTALASLQVGSHEVGTRQPVEEIHARCRAHGIPLLLDATSALGRVPLPSTWEVLVGDASSFGGPPLGILAVRPGTRFSLPYAAEAEGRRGLATPWPPLVAAAAAAWSHHEEQAEADATAARALIDTIRAAAGTWPDVEVLGDGEDRLPHVLTLSALYVDGELLVSALDREGICVGSGSACTSSRLEPSHVLVAIGALTHGNVRITLPVRGAAPDRGADVARLIDALPRAIAAVRAELGVNGL